MFKTLKSVTNEDTKKARKVFQDSTVALTQSISVKDIIFHDKARRKHTTVDTILRKELVIFIKATQYHKLYHTKI